MINTKFTIIVTSEGREGGKGGTVQPTLGAGMGCMAVENFKTFSSVHSLSRVQLFATPWIAARQASLPITNSRSSLKLTSIEAVMPSSHLILCRPIFLLPPIPESFPVSQLFAWGGQSTGVSALSSFLPKKSQGWSPSEWTGWILSAIWERERRAGGHLSGWKHPGSSWEPPARLLEEVTCEPRLEGWLQVGQDKINCKE